MFHNLHHVIVAGYPNDQYSDGSDWSQILWSSTDIVNGHLGWNTPNNRFVSPNDGWARTYQCTLRLHGGFISGSNIRTSDNDSTFKYVFAGRKTDNNSSRTIKFFTTLQPAEILQVEMSSGIASGSFIRAHYTEGPSDAVFNEFEILEVSKSTAA